MGWSRCGVMVSADVFPVTWYLIGYSEDEEWNLADFLSMPALVLA